MIASGAPRSVHSPGDAEIQPIWLVGDRRSTSASARVSRIDRVCRQGVHDEARDRSS
jgi:hypothetical protein